MYIKEIELNNFRLFKNKKFIFNPGTNLIYGCNGSGKTTILESIFYLSLKKSFRDVNISSLSGWGKNSFSVKGAVNGDFDNNYLIETIYMDSVSNIILNKKKTSFKELRELIYPIFFSSYDYNMELDKYSYMRRLVNRFIHGVDSLYIFYVLRYNKALEQKKKLLKNNSNLELILSWNKVIAESSWNIFLLRKKFIKEINFYFIKKTDDEMKIKYKPFFGDIKTKNEMFEKYNNYIDKEVEKRQVQCGTHIDRYAFYKKGKLIKSYSSGERKIYMLNFYLAYLEYFKKINNKYPIFLVDDYDTAIDENNQKKFLDSCPNLQIIATSVKKNISFSHNIELHKE